ncbi:MAG: glucose-1-phosphate thymidylyltransferase, partial [Opitutae bacterium]|nr:glucose-1-phosphate thymidylyltransferase [Opitutae bacterium]
DFVRVIEKRQGLKIACLEEIALYKNWMSPEGIEKAAHAHGSSTYGKYLKNLLLKS